MLRFESYSVVLFILWPSFSSVPLSLSNKNKTKNMKKILYITLKKTNNHIFILRFEKICLFLEYPWQEIYLSIIINWLTTLKEYASFIVT